MSPRSPAGARARVRTERLLRHHLSLVLDVPASPGAALVAGPNVVGNAPSTRRLQVRISRKT